MKLGARQLMLVRMLPLCMASLLLWPSIRHAVDARMSLVMLLEFPILLTCGWTLGNMLPAQLSSRLGRLNAMGLSAMTALLMVFSYWMIPAALDEALLTPAAYS
ncbi:MAG: hypothetical protein JO370_13210, partial [Paucibacter sp.]|nr:hypothetical protein [Roseateles sp.]